MARGDHIRVSRGVYYHHGIDLGNGSVIHFTGEVFSKLLGLKEPEIRQDSKDTFCWGGQAEVVHHTNPSSRDLIIKRAQSRLGQKGYQLFSNNCEHFAMWCATGRHQSKQAEKGTPIASGAAGASLGGAGAAAGIGVVGAAGSVAGLSGAGIMSGLAAVGGSAVGGIAALGVAPAAVTTYAMRKVLADDERLEQPERDARQAGRVATVAGAGAGTAGAIGAISAAGSVAGLSGAGITSGLATIGGAVGGGMAAGTVIAVAAPAVAAAGVGYGVYKVWKWLSD